MTYMRQREMQEKAEEDLFTQAPVTKQDLFTRAPVTKREKYMEKQMKKQLHGLQGLTDGFDLGMNTLLDGEKEDDGGSSEPWSKSGAGENTRKAARGSDISSHLTKVL